MMEWKKLRMGLFKEKETLDEMTDDECDENTQKHKGHWSLLQFTLGHLKELHAKDEVPRCIWTEYLCSFCLINELLRS